MSSRVCEVLSDAPFPLWNPQSGEKLWHLSEADSSLLPENSSEGELTCIPSKLHRVVLETQKTQLRVRQTAQKEENNPQAGPDPWDTLPAGRNLILAGTTIRAPKEDAGRPAPTETGTVITALTPWQLTKPEPAGILQAQRGKEETGKREIPATQAAGGFAPGGRMRLPDLAAGAAPAMHPQGAEHRAPSQERPEGKVSPEQDSHEATAPGLSCPSAVPTPGSLCSPGQRGAETTKGAFQTDAPRLKGQRSAWVLWTRAGCDPCRPRDISHTGAMERSRLSSVVSVPPAHSPRTWHTRFWQSMGTFGHRMRGGRDTKCE